MDKVSNLLIATNMAAKEKAKESKYGGFLSAVRVNKSESLVAGKLWYKNLCKIGQLASPVESGSPEETDLELLVGTKMGLQDPESPYPKAEPGNHTDEEIADGFTLISSILYCSSEAIELFKFYNEIIVLHSPPTVLQATMNNLSPGLLTDHLNIRALHRLYRSLEVRFGLQQGAIVAGLATTKELATLLARGDPVVQSISANLSSCVAGNCTSTDRMVKSLPGTSTNTLCILQLRNTITVFVQLLPLE